MEYPYNSSLCRSCFRPKTTASPPTFYPPAETFYIHGGVCSGSSLDDVSLASWWSSVEVTSVDMERKGSFAHLEPSETYIKAFYKLQELEVALVSACLTADQVHQQERLQSVVTWGYSGRGDKLPLLHRTSSEAVHGFKGG